MPKILKDLSAFVRNHKNLPLSIGGVDGRMDSALSEERIISLLLNKGFHIKSPNIEGPTNRAPYDFIAADKYYVNLKISRLTSAADNTNAAFALFYTLTGGPIMEVPKGDQYYLKLREGIANFSHHPDKEKNIYDFYYMIIGKNESPASDKRCFITSLRTLTNDSVRANANNLPFQCVWAKNMQGERRTYQQSKDFLLSTYAKSMKLRGREPKVMEENFPEYFSR